MLEPLRLILIMFSVFLIVVVPNTKQMACHVLIIPLKSIVWVLFLSFKVYLSDDRE